MKWENLKEEKCPKCSAYLSKDIMYICMFCGFRINFGKMGKIKTLEQQANEYIRNYKKLSK